MYAYTERQEAIRPTSGVRTFPGIAIDIKKNGYRLLTSAEYEFVQRAGTTTTWFFADSDADQEKPPTTPGASQRHRQTHPSGRHSSSPTSSASMTSPATSGCGATIGMWTRPYPETPQVDQTGPASGRDRIARGGAFKNDINHERSAYHWQWAPQDHNYEVGFRICRTIGS